MPRPKNPDGPEPKKRSRNGCWPCKSKKVKCGEEKPRCLNCERGGIPCDYSIRLQWEGRVKRKHESDEQPASSTFSFQTATSHPEIKRSRSHEPQEARPAHVKTNSHEFFQYPLSKASSRSPATASNASPVIGHLNLDWQSTPPNGQMLPPLSTYQTNNFSSQTNSQRANTCLTSIPRDSQSPYDYSSNQLPGVASFQPNMWNSPQQAHSILASRSPQLLNDLPTTPSASSVTSNDGFARPTARSSGTPTGSGGDPRRSSVHSLLSSPVKEEFDHFSKPSSYMGAPLVHNFRPSTSRSYGIDRGMPDLDIPKNDDQHALDIVTPLEYQTRGRTQSEIARLAVFGFGMYGNNSLPKGGYYYSSPREVIIPDIFHPLPSILTQNPMNMMYFHHFLNHTASILVPHDCSENPFKSILPRMALKDDNLMYLLLAYSASHRARLLEHPEPANRIAVYVRDVFPNLRHALNDTSAGVSNSNLAAAIMLASLEIVSPQTFEVPISWQNHLRVARQMVLARGGAQSVYKKDKVSYFLTRWFAYLDILGSLSGSNNDEPLFSGDYWAHDDDFPDEDLQIDCLLGFTSQLVGILAKIGELARQCDRDRIDTDGYIHTEWQPSMSIISDAERLKSQLHVAHSNNNFQGCPHQRPDCSPDENAWDFIEMEATNEAFHCAGLIHLNRRVLGLPSEHEEVQGDVTRIVLALSNVRAGGTAEACLLFPMFTAGCEAKGNAERMEILERLRRVEGSGMTQVCPLLGALSSSS
jgi:hypothetical protein